MTIMVIYITKRVHYTVIPNTKPSSQTTTASPHTLNRPKSEYKPIQLQTERKKTFTDNLLSTLFTTVAADLYAGRVKDTL